jgi:uncharacterized protein YecE (DUF72 family)
MAIHVACGSWADPEYVGLLYPKDLPAKERLSGYARWFDHVEVNSTYYANPREKVVENWVAQTPPGFTFTVKLHRAFSRSPGVTARESDLLPNLLKSLQPLIEAKKLAAFFLVLAPDFTPDKHRLDELDTLVEKLRPFPLAVELRHRDWVQGAAQAETLRYFRERKLVWIAVDMPAIKGSRLLPAIDEVTNPALAYLRLHGRNPNYLAAKSAAEGHTYEYPAAELAEIAARVRTLASRAKAVQVVANNHAQDFAPKAALALKRLLGLKTNLAPSDLYLNFGDE